MIAKYPGRCSSCSGEIEVGSELIWEATTRTGRHATCPWRPPLPLVSVIIPTAWFRPRWKAAEPVAMAAIRAAAWTVAITAHQDDREARDGGSALVAGADLYLLHGGYAPDYREAQAVLRGGAPAYLTALTAAVPEDRWPGKGKLYAQGYVLWRSYPLCVLAGPQGCSG